MFYPRYLIVFILTGIFCLITTSLSTSAQTDSPKPNTLPSEKYQTDKPVYHYTDEDGVQRRFKVTDYSPDPVSDIEWSGGTSGVSDIQKAFNTARQEENIQLGLNPPIPMLTMPSQSEWNTMSDGDRALWLINRERIDRGILPLDGLEENVTSVAQYYADYLLNNDAWGHYEDGNDPWERLESRPAINACHDFLNVAENLAVFMTSGSSIPLPVERSIFNWMYDDGDCCAWGHRHAILWYPYNDNSGTSGKEGFLGIGRANGPYTFDGTNWNFAEMIVMNIFDPCSEWRYVDVDSDIDGMPDKWEVQYGLNPLVNDAAGDLDNDRFTNLEEYQEGTLPNDRNSRPRRGMPWLPLLLGD